MEAMNYLRYDLWSATSSNILMKYIWEKTDSAVDTFTEYQDVIRTDLIGALKTDYDAANSNTNRVAAYTKWARKLDATWVACKLYETSFDWNGGTLGTNGYLGRVNARQESSSKTGAHWFYYWTNKIEDTTNYNTTSSFTVLQAALDAIIPELLKKTMSDTNKQTVSTHFANTMFEFLKYQMKKVDSGKETNYLKALGQGWTASTNTTFGYSKNEHIVNSLVDATADWTGVVSTLAYGATKNFHYKALTNACAIRRSKDTNLWPGYAAGAPDDDKIDHFPMYQAVLDLVAATTGVATTGDAAWKA